MINIALSWSEKPFCVDPQWSTSTASCSSASTASCSTRSFCTGPFTPPSRTRSGTRRGLSAPSFWTRSSSMCGARVCSCGRQAGLATAITQDTLVKTHLLFRVFVVVLSSITSRSVGWSQCSSLMLVVSHATALCVSRRVSSLLVYFCRVSSLRVYFRRVSPLHVFLLGFSCQQIQDEHAVFLVLSVCVIEFLGHASRAHRDGRWYGSA